MKEVSAMFAAIYIAIGLSIVCAAPRAVPSAGSCLCSTATAGLHGRDAAGMHTNVVTTITHNECFKFNGGVQTKEGHTWYELQNVHGHHRVWAASEYLQLSSSSHCGSGSSSGSGGSHCSNVKIIARAQWGARSPKSRHTIHTNPLHEFFVHHTAGHECKSLTSCYSQMKGIQNYHMDTRGWSDIGYSFLVGGDGNIYEGRGWDTVGAHTYGYNSKAYAASFMGTFTSHLPTQAAMQAVKNLTECGVKLGKLSSNFRLYGHRDAGQTECPGNALYAQIQHWSHYSHTHP